MNSTQAYPAVHGDILLLEDDAAFAPLLRDVLSMAGYDVRLARSTPEAMAHIEVGSLAAAVLDWRVLDDNAEGVADRLQSARVPYVFASGAGATAVPERHRWAPFFTKPFASLP
ncbi:TPA: response regulator [Stenotrophomonas maltophilia]|nr:response regulator [Stenotrophomonas maltophilia]